MILVSFSSAEDALSNDVKNIALLARMVLKIRRSAFLGRPVYIIELSFRVYSLIYTECQKKLISLERHTLTSFAPSLF